MLMVQDKDFFAKMPITSDFQANVVTMKQRA